MSGPTVLNFKEVRKGALRGFAQVRFASGLIINDVAILAGPNGLWASPPSKPMVGRDGSPITDANGKQKYSQIIEFVDKTTRDRFSKSIVAAIVAVHPELAQ
ncbi:MAG: septation protein SpoVG family protein [Acetobacteraceae bacterium]